MKRNQTRTRRESAASRPRRQASPPGPTASLAVTIASLPAANHDLNSMVVALEHCRQVGMDKELTDLIISLSGAENAWLADALIASGRQVQSFLSLHAASAQAAACSNTIIVGGAN